MYVCLHISCILTVSAFIPREATQYIHLPLVQGVAPARATTTRTAATAAAATTRVSGMWR